MRTVNKKIEPKAAVESSAETARKASEKLARHNRLKAALIFGATLALVCIVRGDIEMLSEVLALQGTAIAAFVWTAA
jgi:hypothetical protein